MRFRQSAHRRDANHKAIVKALRAAGWHVLDTSQAGVGVPDLVVVKQGRVVFVEVKNLEGLNKISESQKKLQADLARAGVPLVIVTSIDEAVRLSHV